LKREKEAKSTILIEKELPTNFEFSTIADVNNIDLLEMRKDKRLAFKKPEAYCADRCLSTGHCDVYEDFLEMSVKEVLAFCEECVLSDHDEVSICTVQNDKIYNDVRYLTLLCLAMRCSREAIRSWI
jgi:hypothetical protein